MPVTLTWDLFIIVFVALVIAYSFIVGKHQAIEIIIATYISCVTVQGIGNIVDRFREQSHSLLTTLGLPVGDAHVFSTAKIILFVALIVFLTIRAGFEVNYTKDIHPLVTISFTVLFGAATAGLILSTLLTYIAGLPLLTPSLASAPELAPLLHESQLISFVVEYQSVFFSLPAMLLIAMSFFTNKQ